MVRIVTKNNSFVTEQLDNKNYLVALTNTVIEKIEVLLEIDVLTQDTVSKLRKLPSNKIEYRHNMVDENNYRTVITNLVSLFPSNMVEIYTNCKSPNETLAYLERINNGR